MFICLEKVDSPCCCIWALNKTVSDNIVKIVSRAEEAITDDFCMDVTFSRLIPYSTGSH